MCFLWFTLMCFSLGFAGSNNKPHLISFAWHRVVFQTGSGLRVSAYWQAHLESPDYFHFRVMENKLELEFILYIIPVHIVLDYACVKQGFLISLPCEFLQFFVLAECIVHVTCCRKCYIAIRSFLSLSRRYLLLKKCLPPTFQLYILVFRKTFALDLAKSRLVLCLNAPELIVYSEL